MASANESSEASEQQTAEAFTSTRSLEKLEEYYADHDGSPEELNLMQWAIRGSITERIKDATQWFVSQYPTRRDPGEIFASVPLGEEDFRLYLLAEPGPASRIVRLAEALYNIDQILSQYIEDLCPALVRSRELDVLCYLRSGTILSEWKMALKSWEADFINRRPSHIANTIRMQELNAAYEKFADELNEKFWEILEQYLPEQFCWWFPVEVRDAVNARWNLLDGTLQELKNALDSDVNIAIASLKTEVEQLRKRSGDEHQTASGFGEGIPPL